MEKIKIGEKNIGENFPCFTIAEAGANHDGDVNKALKLIDSAIDAKSDSIKFQSYKASKLTTKSAPKYWEDDNPDETQYDVFKKLDTLTEDNWKEIFEYANKKEIPCFSTPFDEESIDFLYKLNIPAFKIASADITYLPLIKKISAKQLPVFLSTGMASDKEIDEAVETIRNEGNEKIILMHCMTSYPTKPEDANLQMIQTLSDKYSDCIVGYSDHTIGTTIALCSKFYGSNVIEKHFTYDRDLEQSPDHRLSLDVESFGQLVSQLRLSEISKGNNIRENFDCELNAIKYARRSIVSIEKISKGDKIMANKIAIKRPATGIYPKFLDQVINSIAKVDIEKDQPIKWEDIENK